MDIDQILQRLVEIAKSGWVCGIIPLSAGLLGLVSLEWQWGMEKEKQLMESVLDRHIEVTPDVRGGKPRIANTRITVADVVLMHLRLGQSLEEIAGKYDLPLAAIYAAVAYYYDHRAVIDQSIEEDVAFAEAFRRDNPSPLQEKLKALGRD